MSTQRLLEALRALCMDPAVGVLNIDGTATGTLRAGPVADEARAALADVDGSKQHFHLIFAEVGYRDNAKRHDVKGTRVNVFTKSPDLLFPSRRLNHIQNSAAMQARNDVGNPPFFEPVLVNILGMYYLGEFTDAGFYAGIQAKTEPAPESTPSPLGSNITPIKPN